MSFGGAVSGRGLRDPSSLAEGQASDAQPPGPRSPTARATGRLRGGRGSAHIPNLHCLTVLCPPGCDAESERETREMLLLLLPSNPLTPQKAPNKTPREACLLARRCAAGRGPRATALPPPPVLFTVYFVVSGLIKMLVAGGSDLPGRSGCSAPAFPSVFTPAQTPPRSPV